MKRKTGIIKRIIKKFRSYKDRKFREKIDRVYFNVDENGNRFIKGAIHVVHDEKTGTIGNITAWADKKQEDIVLTLPVFHAQYLEWLKHSSQQEDQ